MGTISKDAYKRAFLLYLVGQFREGVFGLARLNKVVYFSTKGLRYVPFEFRKWKFGQFSEQLGNENDLLLSMGYLSASRLDSKDGSRGNKYVLANRELLGFYQVVISHVLKKDLGKIDSIVKEIGYRPEQRLLEFAYKDQALNEAKEWDVILKEKLPDKIEINLPEDDCEDLELSLNPDFIQAMTLIDRGLEHSRIDLDKVKRVVKLI